MAESAEARGAVALAHPMGLAAKGFWLKHGHADLLRGGGFHVLAFDFNGFGESTSTTLDYPADAIAAGQYLQRQYPALPIAILGSSFGAGWALCALARARHPFRAAVLEATFPTLPYFWRRYRLPYAMLRASQLLYPDLERNLQPIRAAAQVQGHPEVLLIHGTGDAVTPPDVGEQLRAAMSSRANVELWQAPGAEHNFALRALPDDYARRVLDCLRRASARAMQSQLTV